MTIIYILVFSIIFLFMNRFQWMARKTDNPIAEVTGYLTIVADVTVLTSIFATFLPGQDMALLMQCIHYAGTEWVLIFLLLFMETYTKGGFATNRSRMIFYVLTVLSNISLLLNGVAHHVVTSQYVNFENNVMCYVYENHWPGYQIHLIYCCILALCNVIVLVDTTVHTTRFYRKKFFIPLGMLTLTFVLEFICGMLAFPLDFSLLVYMLLVIFFIYYTIYYKPKGLITKTLSYVVKDSRSALVCFDIEGKCIYANEEAMNLYGNPSGYAAMESIFHREIGGIDFSEMEERTWNTVFEKGQKKLHYQITFTKLLDKDSYIGCFFALHNKTDDVERYMRERHKATHDSLTQLLNREHFYERVKRTILAHPDTEYYIVAIDIKDFKLINDLFGFEKGNEILIQLATLMREKLPEETICGRMESDHFSFCTPKEFFAEEMVVSCFNEVRSLLSSIEYKMHIHAGVYVVQPGEQDVSVMCDRANMAISTVKNNYDCMIAYYDTSHMERLMRENHLIGEFEKALSGGQFVMFLQPQVANDGTVLGAEALVRWQHPEQGMIPPGEFIEVFEKAGLIHRLDQYIWELAAKKLKEWKEQGREHLHISVNISAKDFYYLDIYKIFTGLVEQYGISPEKLKLEITETALMMEKDQMLELLEKLQKYGFSVEIDDFGSGYSSLNMLKDIPADVLKIDMGFLRETQNHDRTRIILGMVVEMAKRLQMTVITEGVENQDQLDYLREVGCDMFQGYYFDRPIAVTDFEERYVKD